MSHQRFLTVTMMSVLLVCMPGLGAATERAEGPDLNHSRNLVGPSNLPEVPFDSNRTDARKTLAPYGQLVDCVCDTTWAVGDRVAADRDINTGSVPLPEGSLGTVVCGLDGAGIPLLVAWDDWSGGHDGNGYCSCPNLAAAGSSGWWVECADVAPAHPENLASVCGGDYSVGSRVVAEVDTPSSSTGLSAGTKGTVVCADDGIDLPLLVSWDSWHSGHDGQGACADPFSNPPEGVDSAWWVECFEVGPGSEVSCACDGVFEKGDRVRLLGATSSLVTGQLGTVVCGGNGSPPLLVSWDNWFDGHNGNDHCACPSGNLPDNSGYYVDCSDVAKEYVSIFIDAFEDRDTTKWDSCAGWWCPDESTPEGTGCPADGDDSLLDPNGGCNSDPYSFGAISVDETICGTVGTFTTDEITSRDTDWYHFSVVSSGSHTITVNSPVELLFGFVTDDCSNPTLIESSYSTPGEESTVSATLDPGTYIVFVASADFADVVCTNYTVNLSQR